MEVFLAEFSKKNGEIEKKLYILDFFTCLFSINYKNMFC